jgi:hypothetical protein
MVASTDPTTGVRAEVDVRAVAWGTALRLRLTGVDPGQTCSLVAVAVGGARETAATWTVPERGYREGKLTVDGAVGMPKDKLARFDVVTTEGRILVRVAA